MADDKWVTNISSSVAGYTFHAREIGVSAKMLRIQNWRFVRDTGLGPESWERQGGPAET